MVLSYGAALDTATNFLIGSGPFISRLTHGQAVAIVIDIFDSPVDPPDPPVDSSVIALGHFWQSYCYYPSGNEGNAR
jgi:hypothetical protein